MDPDSGAQVDPVPAAWVLTDLSGVVLHCTEAADQLVHRLPTPVGPGSITTWFEVGDRAAIQRMIVRSTTTLTQVFSPVELRCEDGSTVTAQVVLTAGGGPSGDPAALRWDLHRIGPGDATTQLPRRP